MSVLKLTREIQELEQELSWTFKSDRKDLIQNIKDLKKELNIDMNF